MAQIKTSPLWPATNPRSPVKLALMDPDINFMQMALDEAKKAEKLGEVPIGAVITHQGQVIAQAHNLKESTQDPLGHAEILAIQQATKQLGRWRLSDCCLYVTLEPCSMCAGAIVQARIDRVVFATSDPKAGACGSLMNLVQDERLNHRVELVSGPLAETASQLLSHFFKALRARNSKT